MVGWPTGADIFKVYWIRLLIRVNVYPLTRNLSSILSTPRNTDDNEHFEQESFVIPRDHNGNSHVLVFVSFKKPKQGRST